MKNYKKYFLIPLFAGLFFSCSKKTDVIPYVPVDFNIYLSEPANINLNSVGGWEYVTGGVKGIIIYRKIDGFAAYDRACPYDQNASNARVDVDTSGLILIDRNCGSQYNILDGSVTKGPATTSLKGYAADFDGVSIVHVHN